MQRWGLVGWFALSSVSSVLGSLLDAFDAVPGHLTEDLHLYSLSDLSATKKGDLVPRLAELLKAGSLHVEKCMVRPPCLPPAWLHTLRSRLCCTYN